MTWGEAVKLYGGSAALEKGLRPVATPADVEYMIQGVPPQRPSGSGVGGGGSSSSSGAPPRGGTYVPLLTRPTGKGVEDRWREMDSSKREDVMAKHPVNATKLHAKLSGSEGQQPQ